MAEKVKFTHSESLLARTSAVDLIAITDEHIYGKKKEDG
jgi:hypothetical protein